MKDDGTIDKLTDTRGFIHVNPCAVDIQAVLRIIEKLELVRPVAAHTSIFRIAVRYSKAYSCVLLLNQSIYRSVHGLPELVSGSPGKTVTPGQTAPKLYELPLAAFSQMSS